MNLRKLLECKAEGYAVLRGIIRSGSRVECAMDGYLACARDLLPLVELMLEALSTIDNECSCDTPDVCYDVAKEALAQFDAAIEGWGKK